MGTNSLGWLADLVVFSGDLVIVTKNRIPSTLSNKESTHKKAHISSAKVWMCEAKMHSHHAIHGITKKKKNGSGVRVHPDKNHVMLTRPPPPKVAIT